MLERSKGSSHAFEAVDESDPVADFAFPGGLAIDPSIDRELQAAIEYKIAACGVAGADTVLALLDIALRRLLR